MKKIILMANDIPGIQIADYLNNCGDKIVRLYLHDDNNLKYGDEIVEKSKCKNIFRAKELKDPKHLDSFKKEKADFIITVYWAYLLKPEIFNSVKDTVNFHPAFLPINRGWYPHVHSLIDNTKSGVTLHRIDEGADTGPIWVQKEIKISKYHTAKDHYDRLQSEIINLFKNNWDGIKNDSIKPFSQDNSKAIYRKKSSIKNLDNIDLNKSYIAKDLIALLRARSFGELGFANYISGGEKVFLNLRLSKNNSFKQTNEEGT